MKKNCFVGSISSLIWETFKFTFLSTISLGIAMPWLLRNYLTYIYTFTVFEDGTKLSYRDCQPSKLLLINLMYLLLGIVTLGIFYISYAGKLIDYITLNTQVKKNDVIYRKRLPGSLGDHFVFGLWMILYSLLLLVSLGFATPFVLLKTVKRASSYFMFCNRDNKENILRLSFTFTYIPDDTKNKFVKDFFVNNTLLLVTFGLYCGYYYYYVFNGLLQFVRVHEHNK